MYLNSLSEIKRKVRLCHKRKTLKMKKLSIILLPILLCFIVGCASNQRIYLFEKNSIFNKDNRLEITDLRTKEEKEIRYNLELDCERWYGDVYLQPDKVSVLKQSISNLSNGAGKINIKLTTFDTVEVCVIAAKKIHATAQSAAVSSAISAQTGLPVFIGSTSHVEGEDYFKMRIAGEINGKPFDVADEFGYGDIKMASSFDETKEYVNRIKKLLDELVLRMLKKIK